MTVQRFGMVNRLGAEHEAAYRALHAGPGVRDLLERANIRNFNIFLHRLPDGELYEFAYYEYHGSDYGADMALLDADPRNIEWLKTCDPMQQPLPGAQGWSMMEPIYYNP